MNEKASDPRLVQRACPYYDCNKQLCLASTTLMVPDRRQQMQYCASDDYDNCPLYLCKALRSSRRMDLITTSCLTAASKHQKYTMTV